MRLNPLHTPEGYEDAITKQRWFKGVVDGVYKSGALKGAVKVTLPRNWVDRVYGCLECCACCVPFLNDIGMLHKKRQAKRQELFKQYV